MTKRILAIASFAMIALLADSAVAAEAGEVVQTDNLGMNLVTWNLSKGTHKTVGDERVLSEFVGAHVYVAEDVRIGMNLQFSEQLSPEPASGGRFRTFAFLPQVGWNFHEPFFVAAIATIAPRTAGGANTLLGVQALGGAAFAIADGVKVGIALEVPYNFYPEHTIGLTPIAGLSFRL